MQTDFLWTHQIVLSLFKSHKTSHLIIIHFGLPDAIVSTYLFSFHLHLLHNIDIPIRIVFVCTSSVKVSAYIPEYSVLGKISQEE